MVRQAQETSVAYGLCLVVCVLWLTTGSGPSLQRWQSHNCGHATKFNLQGVSMSCLFCPCRIIPVRRAEGSHRARGERVIGTKVIWCRPKSVLHVLVVLGVKAPLHNTDSTTIKMSMRQESGFHMLSHVMQASVGFTLI